MEWAQPIASLLLAYIGNRCLLNERVSTKAASLQPREAIDDAHPLAKRIHF